MRKWIDQGRAVLLGVSQEQQADRCRLFAQWKRLDFPIVHDRLNLLGVRSVPVPVAIDEYGIVRRIGGGVSSLERDFVSRKFPRKSPIPKASAPKMPDLPALKRAAMKKQNSEEWRGYADALVTWKGLPRIDEAVEAYSRAFKLDPKDARSLFRLGVCYRMRQESDHGHAGDADRAMDLWKRAFAHDRKQYIWRRRIQQYSRPSSRPYPFYDWVDRAGREIRGRGEKPCAIARPPGRDYTESPSKREQGDAGTAERKEGKATNQ